MCLRPGVVFPQCFAHCLLVVLVVLQAPEQFEGCPVTEKVDVFAFGVLLWECFEQQQPWKDLSPMQIIYAVGLQVRMALVAGACVSSPAYSHCKDGATHQDPQQAQTGHMSGCHLWHAAWRLCSAGVACSGSDCSGHPAALMSSGSLSRPAGNSSQRTARPLPRCWLPSRHSSSSSSSSSSSRHSSGVSNSEQNSVFQQPTHQAGVAASSLDQPLSLVFKPALLRQHDLPLGDVLKQQQQQQQQAQEQQMQMEQGPREPHVLDVPVSISCTAEGRMLQL